MDDKTNQPIGFRRRRLILFHRLRLIVFIIVLAAGLAFDLATALYLNNNPPDGDAKIYSRFAINLIDHAVFSAEEGPDENGKFQPSIIRLPGYPLFIAAIYSVAGRENYSAVKAVQGVLHFASAVIAAYVAFLWAGGKRRRRRKAAVLTFILAAFCPFTVNYSAVLLTEVPTIFLMAAMMLTATLAIRSRANSRSILWWLLSGILGGLAVEMRPESGLFSLAIGLALVVATIAELGPKNAIVPMIKNGLAFSAAFVIVLTPWTIRNVQVFGQFQPLAPQYAAAPGEFVPRGYLHWLRTWVDDFKYVGPTQWDLEIHRIDINKFPASAFDSDEEKAQIAALIDQYNNSDPDHPLQPKSSANDSDDDKNSADSDNDDSDDNDKDSADSDQSDDQSDDQNAELNLHISPESDAQFEQIAEQRIERHPMRYYVELPAKRAVTTWFDTHSDFYPFAGALFPLAELDTDTYQDVWLPLFAVIDGLYTLLAIGGSILLLIGGWPRSRIWLFMALMIAITRIILFSTMENPEPRYLIELFSIASILGGIALSRIRFVRGKGSLGLQIIYGRGRTITN